MLSDRLTPETIRYNSGAGRYTRNGRFVPEREIDALAIIERNILSRKLERLTNRLVTYSQRCSTRQRGLLSDSRPTPEHFLSY
ncbi:MAG: hypothetical protein QNJ33_11815 [Crocosphaera sp.]|nr:hypothetical protein [Crocosphaera sp.]